MLLPTVQGWLKRTASLLPAHHGELHASATDPQHDAGGTIALVDAGEGRAHANPLDAWPAGRLAVTDQLWGEGFTLAGGEVETMRLAHPLGLSSAASLLLVGAGGGGPAGSIARNLGAWVTGLEVEPALVAQAQKLLKAAALGKKATVDAWNPHAPGFEPRRYHHCLAIEPLRSGGEPAEILDGLAQALKVGGQLVMTELVADPPPSPDDPRAVRWSKLEHRALSTILQPQAITRMLRRVGFDVRVAEDVSARHVENALIGWRTVVRSLRHSKPPPALAATLVAEAEIWLLRVRLVRQHRMRMMRWHAISTAAAPPRP